jgi:hypothetical protein
MTTLLVRLALLFALALATLTQWPQWGGAPSDFRVDSDAETVWGKSAPRLVWKRPLGEGEAAVLVEGDVLYTTYRDGGKGDGEEVIVALAAEDGSSIWEHR